MEKKRFFFLNYFLLQIILIKTYLVKIFKVNIRALLALLLALNSIKIGPIYFFKVIFSKQKPSKHSNNVVFGVVSNLIFYLLIYQRQSFR